MDLLVVGDIFVLGLHHHALRQGTVAFDVFFAYLYYLK